MIRLSAGAALFLLLLTTAAGAAEPKLRAQLATSAAFDDDGRLWRVRLTEGHVVVDASDDQGASFAPAVRVNAAPEAVAAEGEQRPEIALAGQGRIYVAWTSPLPQPYAGHVRFAHSDDGGRTFAAPLTVNDNREAITHRFQSLHVAADGRLTVAWIDKRDLEAAKRAGQDHRGAAIYYSVSADGGASFEPNRRLAAHSCECCRIALASDTDGAAVAFWRHTFADGTRDHALARIGGLADDKAPARATHEGWRVNACPHHGPDLAIGADGTRHGAWFNQADGVPGLFYGAWRPDGRPLGAPMRFGAANAAHPALLILGRRVLLAWKAFDGERTVVSVMESADGGRRWSAPRSAATAADASDHPRLIAWRDRAYLSWATLAEGYRLIPLAVAEATP
ncbi:MAG: exo-alpha-sialidase [Rhodocyclales bacterium]|nr:exo-alpha-sialidase [Rhodocyclales bacterium]